MQWFYFVDDQGTAVDKEGNPRWRGSHELRRNSSVIRRQRSFKVLGRRFFFGSPEVETEVIWRWAAQP